MAIHHKTAFGKRSLAVSQYPDIALVVLSMVPALLLGAPKLGYVLGAGGWVVQRLIATIDKRWTRRLVNPYNRICVGLFEAFGRIWLLAGVIVLAAVAGGRPDGLTAALIIFGAYSIALVSNIVTALGGQRAVN